MNGKTLTNPVSNYTHVILAAAITLLFELTLTRILSFIFWNHLVYLTISLALLGFGISGTLVVLVSHRREFMSPRIVSLLWFGFGISMLFALSLSTLIVPLLCLGPPWLRLGVCYLVYTIPFVFGGAILSIIFSSAKESMAKLYFVDLLAAGLGCLAFFFLLPAVGAPNLVIALCLVSLLIAARSVDRSNKTLISLSLGGGAASVMLSFSPFDFVTEENKEIYEAAAVVKPEYTKWTPISRIDVMRGDVGAGNSYQVPPPATFKILTQDGTAHTRLVSAEAIEELRLQKHSGGDLHGSQFPYLVKQKPEVAIIGVGGGIDAAYAVINSATRILGIELNPATFDIITNRYSAYMGHLMRRPEVTLVEGEGRSVLRRSNESFDLLQIIAVDTFAALSTGAYALSENYLYTVEAFKDFFARLKPDGIVSVYRWLFHPPRESLRLSVLALTAWRELGVKDGDRRLIVLQDSEWSLSMFKRSAFTAEEVLKVRENLGQGQNLLYFPSFPEYSALNYEAHIQTLKGDTRKTAAIWRECVSSFRDGRDREFIRDYEYDISPTSDDSPFFFEYFFKRNLLQANTSSLRGGVGFSVLVMLIQAAVLSVLAIFLPLLKYSREGLAIRNAFEFSVYFCALGFGFMVLEVALIQKLVLFLGSPLHSLSVVLASLLIFAAIGSALQSRLDLDVKRVSRLAGSAFIIYCVMLILGLLPRLDSWLNLPFAGKVLMVLSFLLPAGILMGMFFPSGVAEVKRMDHRFVPWAWGINGCCSVFGSILAIVIAIMWGFTAALWAGVICYAMGFLVAQRVTVTR
jgi:hypothetical protein